MGDNCRPASAVHLTKQFPDKAHGAATGNAPRGKRRRQPAHVFEVADVAGIASGRIKASDCGLAIVLINGNG